MPKLTKEKAKAAESVTDSFGPIPEGLYDARLYSVTSKEAMGSGNTYWSWEYRITDGPFEGRKLWDNTSLSDAAAFRIKQTFDAFGVPADTDTDDLCGRAVQLTVTQRVIERGARAGEIGNNVEKVLSAKTDENPIADSF
jgi:hypothetical protein